MKRYLISGGNGSGKSTVGRELDKRGYDVIEADFEEGLSSWVNKSTGQKARHQPPFTEEWLAEHSWIWDSQKLNPILEDKAREALFVVGGAANMSDFLPRFNRFFALYIDDNSLVSRLTAREPKRWAEGSPELSQALEWNHKSFDWHQKLGAIMLDGTKPVEEIANEILEKINA